MNTNREAHGSNYIFSGITGPKVCAASPALGRNNDDNKMNIMKKKM